MIFSKAKNEEKYKKNYFDLVQIKNSFAIFRKIKSNILKRKKIQIFIFVDCSLMNEEDLCKFKKN